jgi:arginyl-tRNA--protein-N-Asp/Glu arginylyltransferase
MHKFQSEFGHNYKTYSFGYANYCVREQKDKLSDIYAAGYLPYSSSPGVKDIFYMARSARVPLAEFIFSSENRRVAGKFDPVGSYSADRHSQRGRTSNGAGDKLVRVSMPFKDFNTGDKNFKNFCVSYFTKRHGPKVMPEKRLETILDSDLITNVVSYTGLTSIRPAAYVFEVSDKNITHFWYSFYDLSLVGQSLGMWLMLDSARHAKDTGKKYFYAGTVYSEKALYKTAFDNIEYWNGSEWIADKKQLKKLGRSDNERAVNITDEWKNKAGSF